MLIDSTVPRPILCVNPNAAIDKTIVVDNFSLDKIHRPQRVVSTAGGKGCNVARVLKTLGEMPIVTGWVGGHAGRYIEAALRTEGIRPAFARSDCESRTCLSIYDSLNHTLTEIYESGEPVSGAALRTFFRRYRALLEACSLVTLSGSLPVGVPASLYADLIHLAHRAGVPVLLDSSGEPLRLGMSAGPRLIKPNRFELCALLGQDLISFDQIVAAAHDLSRRHATTVVVSLGAEGAVAVSAGAIWQARPPAVQAQSAVGSGDAMLAGLAIGLTRGQPLEEALRLGVAAGAANTLTIGAGRLKRENVDEILPGVTIQRLQRFEDQI
jgi:tagatose 6-phosphate kinase